MKMIPFLNDIKKRDDELFLIAPNGLGELCVVCNYSKELKEKYDKRIVIITGENRIEFTELVNQDEYFCFELLNRVDYSLLIHLALSPIGNYLTQNSNVVLADSKKRLSLKGNNSFLEMKLISGEEGHQLPTHLLLTFQLQKNDIDLKTSLQIIFFFSNN